MVISSVAIGFVLGSRNDSKDRFALHRPSLSPRPHHSKMTAVAVVRWRQVEQNLLLLAVARDPRVAGRRR